MLLDTIFAPFVKERPICVMARAVLERLLDAPRVDALFARTAQHQILPAIPHGGPDFGENYFIGKTTHIAFPGAEVSAGAPP